VGSLRYDVALLGDQHTLYGTGYGILRIFSHSQFEAAVSTAESVFLEEERCEQVRYYQGVARCDVFLNPAQPSREAQIIAPSGTHLPPYTVCMELLCSSSPVNSAPRYTGTSYLPTYLYTQSRLTAFIFFIF